MKTPTSLGGVGGSGGGGGGGGGDAVYRNEGKRCTSDTFLFFFFFTVERRRRWGVSLPGFSGLCGVCVCGKKESTGSKYRAPLDGLISAGDAHLSRILCGRLTHGRVHAPPAPGSCHITFVPSEMAHHDSASSPQLNVSSLITSGAHTHAL